MKPGGPRVGLILLAAGGSTRMGRPKQDLEWGGEPMLRRAARSAVATGCRPVVVVLGAHLEVTRAAVAGLPIDVAVNPSWQAGMGSSLNVGVGAILAAAPELDGVAVMLADQPLVTSAAVARLVAVFSEGRAGIVAAGYGETRGVPAVLGRAALRDVAALDPAGGAKRLIEGGRHHVAVVGVPEAAIDIDTPADYAQGRPPPG
jgi:molybdenum cofactor cytidylyltransferase